MNPDFHPIIYGIYLMLGLQLLLMAIVRAVLKPNNWLPLALLCLVFSEWFFRRFFWDVWHDHALLMVLIGGYKELFIGPLLYFHLLLKSKSVSWKQIAVHFMVPLVFVVVLNVLRLGFEDVYQSTKTVRFRLHLLTCHLSAIFYLFACFSVIKNQLKLEFQSRVVQRAGRIVLIVLLYKLITFILDFISHLARAIGTPFWDYINNKILFYIHWWFVLPSHSLAALALIIYTVSETPSIRKLILPRDSRVNEPTLENLEEIENRINTVFNVDKAHQDVNFNLQKCLEVVNTTRSSFSQYLKNSGYANFSEFLNKKRIEEFKNYVKNKEHLKYDLLSLATMSGFSSKATFNRTFKQLEGMTPSEFVRSCASKN